MKKTKSTWLKNRGYLHVSPQIDVKFKSQEILSKVRNPDYVSKHAFYPLLHSSIKERRYKIVDLNPTSRAHSFNGNQTAKLRPLHYATHIDALIFGYYAELILKKYEQQLLHNDGLSECITAYRKIEDPDNPSKFKSTINFANEAFTEIKKRAQSECVVLKFDIKSFFSTLDHKILKQSWTKLLNVKTLSKDHYNVFKASTRFSYILKDDLRLFKTVKGRRAGFDEKKLANIRKLGKVSFFESNAEFRECIKNGSLKLHKYPFSEKGKPTGIPQGLPISAVLANLYLLEFDKKILFNIVNAHGAYYRRYSDDIIVVCSREKGREIEKLVYSFIEDSKVVMSPEKTEKFIFKKVYDVNDNSTICSFKVDGDILKPRYPFTYLGFEFNGEQVLIKSGNLARFYRRMILAVKRKASRAAMISNRHPDKPIVIYRNQLIRLYSNIALDRLKVLDKRKTLVKTKYGYSIYKSTPFEKKFKSNYFSYARRASKIMRQPCIENQLNKHRNMFNQAIYKQVNKNIKRLGL